jgi:DNA mismatch repair protein MutS
MSQYRDIKSQHQDSILLFRVGDFYETFYEDAVDVSSILNIALTTRDKNKPNPIPLAGVPFHAAENYIARLLFAGRKVALCEQVEDPALARGLVRREVVEVLTPGTALHTQLLRDEENNYCLSVYADGVRAGIALIDVSTGDFLCGAADEDTVHHLVQGKRVREMVVQGNAGEAGSRPGEGEPRLDSAAARMQTLTEALGRPYLAPAPAEDFEVARATELVERQFGAGAVEREKLSPHEVIAAGALLGHVFRLRDGDMPQVVAIERLDGIPFLSLDDETIGNLELFEPLRGGAASATLVHTIDRTVTPMGGREIRRWMQKPLCHAGLIDERAWNRWCAGSRVWPTCSACARASRRARPFRGSSTRCGSLWRRFRRWRRFSKGAVSRSSSARWATSATTLGCATRWRAPSSTTRPATCATAASSRRASTPSSIH